tara:strand:+ start:690 stop:1841 length:1152 start_codon:yes stop_codon:yes gene_type:complete
MKFKIENPPQREIVIFDGTSLNDLKYILHKKKFFVLENRKSRISTVYCSLNIIITFFFNFFLLFFKNKNLHTIYLFTLLEKINPKIVITSIDNSFKFAELAKLLSKKIKFAAIQNANRFDYMHNIYLFKKNLSVSNLNNKYFIPHFFCFGEHEINQIKKYKINIDQVYKVGSIRVANFFKHIELNKIKLQKEKYDVCLISEAAPNINEKFEIKDLEEKFAKVAKFTIDYSKKYNLKFIFLQKRNLNSIENKEEMNFYKKYLNKNDFNFLKKNSSLNQNNYSSYLGLFQSKLAVGAQSTLLRDKIGCKEKILSLGLDNEGLFEFPINGICKLKNLDYLEFENRMNLILSLNSEDYFAKIEEPINNLIEFDENFSTIDKIIAKLF